MNGHLNELLSAYVDGDLAGDDLARTEAHLAGCESCRAELEGLRRLVRRARSLDDRAPEKDLWAGIAQRIGSSPATTDVVPLEPRRRRLVFTIPQLAAAAVALMAVSVAAGVMLNKRHDTAQRASQQQTGVTSDPRFVRNPGDLTVSSYDSAITGMQQMLEQHRGQLDTATVRVVEQSLAAIDLAIQQARAALVRDPNNRYLNGHLQRALDRKLDLLRQVATLTAAS